MSTKNNFYTLRPIVSNCLEYSSIQKVHSIELKFGKHIIDNRPDWIGYRPDSNEMFGKSSGDSPGFSLLKKKIEYFQAKSLFITKLNRIF